MHAAAGLATAVAAVELVPRAIERVEVWMLALALFTGALASLFAARISRTLSKHLPKKDLRATTVGAYIAVGVDLTIDGLMTGSGAAVATSLGVLLALSQVIGNLPGGFAIAGNFRTAGIPRLKRLAMLGAYPLLPPIGAAIGYVALRGASESVIGLALAFLAGLLLTATIEEIVPEADEPGAPRRISSPSFAAGFAALLLMTTYI